MVERFSRRKGQSAIEYLTTYGWMLLVIAIVGGAIFSTVQGSAQVQSTTGFSTADVQIDNFGVNEGTGELQMVLRASSQQPVEDINVTMFQRNSNEKDWSANSASEEVTIPVGQTETVTFDNITSTENTNTFDVKVEYSTGSLNNLQINGSLTGQLAHENELS